MLTFSMARSAAFHSLSGPALKVFIELRCRYNGDNAGKLHLSYAEAARSLGLSKTSVHRAFAELTEKGFVRLTRQGTRYARQASEWATTDLPSAPGELATQDWKRWQAPAKNRTSVLRRNQRGPDGSATVPVASHRSVIVPKNTPGGPSDGSATVLHIHSTMRSVKDSRPGSIESASVTLGEPSKEENG